MDHLKFREALSQVAQGLSELFEQKNERVNLDTSGLGLGSEREDFRELREAITLLKEENESLCQENDKLHSRLQELEFEPELDSRQYYTNTIKQLEKRLEDSECMNTDLSGEIDELKEELEKLEETKDDLSLEIEELEEKVEELKEQLDQLEVDNEEFAECKISLEREEELTENLTNENERLLEENKSLKAELEKYKRNQVIIASLLEALNTNQDPPKEVNPDPNKMWVYLEKRLPPVTNPTISYGSDLA